MTSFAADDVSGPDRPSERRIWAEALARLPDGLERPVAERAAWLTALGCEPAVRERLERLLDERAGLEAQDFLGAPAGAGLEAPGNAVPGLQEGTLVGKYRLIREIGRGGMSVVWLAELDDDGLARKVALKFPGLASARPDFVRRLRRERRILSALEHPHIARLYDIGNTDGGLPYLVLEYVEGTPIDQHCRDHRLDVPARLDLFTQVLEAVGHAHARLVLHRDIKPSNVLVDASGRVRLLDFGIAKAMDDPDTHSHATLLTVDGVAPLTPAYASPEQMRGDLLGAASDVYSLGVLLHELLTGQRPQGTPGLYARPSDIVRRLVATDAVEMPRDTVQQLRGDLDAIVLKSLEPDPTRRYPSAESLQQDLWRHRRSEPVRARPRRRGYVLSRFLRRHRVVVAAGAVSTLALVGGLSVAVHQALRATDEAARARAVSDFMVEVFEANSIDAPDAAMARRQPAEVLLARGARALESGALPHPGARDALREVLGRLLHDLGMADQAREVRSARLHELDRDGASAQVQAVALRDLAATQAASGDLAAAERMLVRAQAKLDGEDGGRAGALRAELSVARGELAQREGRVTEARRHLADAHAADPSPSGRAFELDAALLGAEGQPDAAAARLRDSVSLHRDQLRGRPARLGAALYRVASAMHELGRTDDALALLREANQQVSASAGDGHPSAVLIRQEIGRMLLYRGDIAEAQAVLGRTHRDLMDLGERIDPRGRVRAADFLAEAHLANGRLRDAERALAEAGAIRSGVDELPFEDRFYHDLLVAQLDTAQGRYDQALMQIDRITTAVTARLEVGGAAWIDLQLRAVDILRKAGRPTVAALRLREVRTALAERPALAPQFGAAIADHEIVLRLDIGQADAAAALLAMRSASERHGAASTGGPKDLVHLWYLGRIDLATGRPREAQRRFEGVIESLDALGHPNHPELAQARLYLADAWSAQGRSVSARALRRQALAALDAEGAGPHYRRMRPVEASAP